ncbi:four-carbon acid sugar kinase family protein [Cohnella zeiphila]|uniref:Four-carbon acid sugar kinase family protein n=1 Tax=Cohnella zeiphila TaxID=2761120 RepID=A0A7X0VX61_9BACL|nr:four-carbon acid sugar kinase family protein [Cohnella zeiphila]MBB6733240.1 four-carbon acid sugar kinase family protein [Cohnella zeiphila]
MNERNDWGREPENRSNGEPAKTGKSAATANSAPIPRPKGRERLLAYYGDDFTGSTDVLEALFHAGLKAALFLEPPTEALLEGRFAGLDAFGVAGVGRSLTPEEMERELRPIFRTMKILGAAVVHYKTCSTFDSSPRIGSIGKAAELGRELFAACRYVPVLAGAPYLGRYTVFGQHFAAAGGTVHRLDRHPTMARHPVTPMAEADLRRHLRLQTEMSSALMDVLALAGAPEETAERLEELLRTERPELVLFDALDEANLEAAGRLIWEEALRSEEGLFVVGSSGVEDALAACWGRGGRGKQEQPVSAPQVSPVDRLLVVSGSCSPATGRQIEQATAAGFAAIRVPAGRLARPDTAAQARAELLNEAREKLNAGRSVILYSASGPEDPGIAELRETLSELGMKAEDSSRLLGAELGRLSRTLIADTGLSRLLVAGGDTSGYVVRELGVGALECVSSLAPGVPLIRTFAEDSPMDGLELALKGGQVGGESFFENVRNGG